MATAVLTPVSTTSVLSRSSSPYHMVLRRNALVPLPLLPPPPANAIVTSVHVVHNVNGDESPPCAIEVPMSPTQYYASALQKPCGMKRPRHQRRRSYSSTCSPPNAQPQSPLCPPVVVNSPQHSVMTARTTPDSVTINTPYSLFGGGRRPRSTVIVTVRLNPPPAPVESTRPSYQRPQLGLIPPPRPPPTTPPPPLALGTFVPYRHTSHKPRVSSSLNPDGDFTPNGPLHIVPSGRFIASSRRYIPSAEAARIRNANAAPRSIKKSGSRLAMLRWALINSSGPEVGRRIMCMGVRLAKEVWEAEKYAEVEDQRTREDKDMLDDRKGDTAINESEEQHQFDKVGIQEEYSAEQMVVAHEVTSGGVDNNTVNAEFEKERERIAEECIRELEEEMDIDEDSEGPTADVFPPVSPETEEDDATGMSNLEEDNSSDGSSSDEEDPVSDEETASMDVDVVSELTPLQVQFNIPMDVQVISPTKVVEKQAIGSHENTRHLSLSHHWFNNLAL